MTDMIVDIFIGSAVVAALLTAYTYAGYPALLAILGRFRSDLEERAEGPLPTVSITLPAYNEEDQIRGAIESLLTVDYPAELRQILVVSDASTDDTDRIVQEYSNEGVELMRLTERRGKTGAENAASSKLTGEIVVNTDASTRMHPETVKRLVAQFHDPAVGVASGRDVSVIASSEAQNAGEAGYVGYEMEVRRLENRVSGIVGASGCCYAIRSHLHRNFLPDTLSRDFAAALVARENGYRSVSVHDAVCYVPRTHSLQAEYRRKVRTMTRGIETLWFKRHLLNPIRYGSFAWMLFSHKVCRWLVPWALALVALTTAAAAPYSSAARWAAVSAGLIAAVAALHWVVVSKIGMRWRSADFVAYAVAGNLAALHASVRALLGDRNSLWEPTRREVSTGEDVTAP